MKLSSDAQNLHVLRAKAVLWAATKVSIRSIEPSTSQRLERIVEQRLVSAAAMAFQQWARMFLSDRKLGRVFDSDVGPGIVATTRC